MQNFIETESSTEAQKQAQIIRKLYETVSTSTKMISRLDLPSFEGPSIRDNHAFDAPVTLPWHRHLQWAREAVAADAAPDIQLGLALMGLGTKDGVPAISERQPAATVHLVPTGEEQRFNTVQPIVKLHNFAGQQFLYDADHQIIGRQLTDRHAYWPDQPVLKAGLGRDDLGDDVQAIRKNLLEGEAARLANRAVDEAVAIENADWSLLDRPGWVEDYKANVLASGLKKTAVGFEDILKGRPWYSASNLTVIDANFMTDKDFLLALQRAEDLQHALNINHFIAENSKLLTPELSVVDGPDEGRFAGQFITRLKAAEPESPAFIQAALQEFFNVMTLSIPTYRPPSIGMQRMWG